MYETHVYSLCLTATEAFIVSTSSFAQDKDRPEQTVCKPTYPFPIQDVNMDTYIYFIAQLDYVILFQVLNCCIFLNNQPAINCKYYLCV